jgi:hypothetical protein
MMHKTYTLRIGRERLFENYRRSQCGVAALRNSPPILIESVAAGIGSKDPNMRDSDRDKACKLLLDAFRSGRFKLVAVGAKWMVVRPATEGREGEVVVCTLEAK